MMKHDFDAGAPPQIGGAQTASSRRTFLRIAGLAAAGGWMGGVAPWIARAGSPAGDLRVAIAGLRGMGGTHINQLRNRPGVRLVALCDVDRDILAQRRRELSAVNLEVDGVEDFRHLLERKDLDAVVIATPNHNHTLQAIWACQAGLDVYVEKPVSHSLFECRQIVQAARVRKRVVQAGTQNRSDVGLREAMAFIHEGGLGKIRLVRGLCYNRRKSIGRTEGPQKIPDSVNYDLWCGPAPMAPLRRAQLHYDWHWFWDTGNGDIGNQGPHELDLCRWALNMDGATWPSKVFALGGRVGYEDDGETPNTQMAWFEGGPAPILFEVRGLPMSSEVDAMDHVRNIRVGIIVEGEAGYFAGGRGGGRVFDWNHKQVRHFPGDGGGGHMANFLDAVRSRDTTSLRAPVEAGAGGAAMAHLANLAVRAGRALGADEAREALAATPAAAEAWAKMEEHCAKNGVDAAAGRHRVGGWLEWDEAKGRFRDGLLADKASAWIRRDYRKPFVVPEIRGPV